MDGEAFLQKLAAAGQQNPLIARALRWIEPGQQGIDVAHPHTAMLLGALLQQEAITQAEYNAVMGIAPKSKPAANVTAEQVWNALNWTGE
jgi:hypothetical protein